MLTIEDSKNFFRRQKDLTIDIIFCDPPYGLGSEIIIMPDGKPDYSKSSDFMNKWDMPTGTFWEEWYKEAYRILKYGGYCIMYGMDRQLLLFKYYAALAGFKEKQSLYWYFTKNFPKASDLSKNIDKNMGEKVNIMTRIAVAGQINPSKHLRSSKEITDGYIKHKPQSQLSKKYEGYKYSISPLKQTNETIMVFQKPYKTGSCLHDVLAYEAGDITCSCGALNIDGNRCPITDGADLARINKKNHRMFKTIGDGTKNTAQQRKEKGLPPLGRYPSQTFISPEVTEVLGDASKILYKCPYEEGEIDLYIYCPKVTRAEREAGMHENESNDRKLNNKTNYYNSHPTVKPISLNTHILKLFKTPNKQRILIPFAGSGSEIIGAIKAGFTDWQACEINPEYVSIAETRIKYWSSKPEQQTIF